MLSSMLPAKKAPQRGEHSPFSSPFTHRTPPAATRRSTNEQHRRVAAEEESPDDDETASNPEVQEEDRGEDEDGPEDNGLTPLLPIFEAALLGQYAPAAYWTETDFAHPLQMLFPCIISRIRYAYWSCHDARPLCHGTSSVLPRCLNFS